MIYIVTHKESNYFKDDHYIPIQVGYNEKNFTGCIRDNIRDNISCKNKNYCELTAIYWIWKNDDSNEKGIVHYRRYFGKGIKRKKPYAGSDLHVLLKSHDIILPKPNHYHIDAKEQLCRNSCDPINFDLLRETVEELYPEYLIEFDDFFKQNTISQYNMMYCRADIFDDYCEWLFNILFALEKKIDLDKLSGYKERIFGFLSERLLNIWVKNKNLNVCYLDVINTDNSLKDDLTLLRREATNRLKYVLKV